MFTRRHPFLFFILVLTAICTTFILLFSLIVMMGNGKWGFASSGKNLVGVVEITGAIGDASHTISSIKQFREDKRIRAILLRIDSPGGGVGPSQEIYREVIKTREAKPIIASMGAVAASGGYYAASAATGIMANPGTVTGSIGVIMGLTNVEGLMEKIGLSPVVIKSGKFKDTGSGTRPMTSDEKALLDNLAKGLHEQFIRDVGRGRNMDVEKIRTIADGRIISGETARELALVDRLGNQEDAIDWAAKEAGITGEVNVVYAEKPRVPWFLKYILNSLIRVLDAELRTQGIRADYL